VVAGLSWRAGRLLVHPHDGGQVRGSEPVAPAEHGERDFPGRGLAFQPALLYSQDLGGFLCRV
jgi:hypothetical protein